MTVRDVARVLSVSLDGVVGRMVEVEAHIAPGLPGLTLVGLGDTAVAQARDRVRAAVLTSRESWPQSRITVNLHPASLPKRGSGFDLAIAAAILAAAGAVPAGPLAELVILAELGLDGRVRPVPGVLPAVLAAVGSGHPVVVVAAASAAEAMLVPGAQVRPVRHLGELLSALRGLTPWPDVDIASDDPAAQDIGPTAPDLADVIGQPLARRAVEVCAAGGHHLYMYGPPGVGKSLLAERLPGLLPPLTADDALEVAAIRSLTGDLDPVQVRRRTPPFEAPHHTATVAAMVGGGSGVLRPGAVSRAHRGVLLLDEAPEFEPRVLDALREPLENGCVTVARSGWSQTVPARVLLVLAANPCPCGVDGTPTSQCVCTPAQRRRYRSRLSGPLLDRVDVQVQVQPISRAMLLAASGDEQPECSELVAARVAAARNRQRARLRPLGHSLNSQVPAAVLRRALPLDAAATRDLGRAVDRGLLSMRGVDRVLRVAWTLADLAGIERPTATQVREGLVLRRGTS